MDYVARLKWKKEKSYSDAKYIIALFMRGGIYEGCSLPVRLERRTGLASVRDNSFGRFLAKKGTGATLNLNYASSQDINCESMTPAGKFKKYIDDVFDRNGIQGRVREISTGIILGKSGYLNRELKRTSLELGIIHLFAASGLHLGILFVCLHVPISFIFGKRHPFSLLAPLPVCFIYCALLSFPVSLLRSFAFLLFLGIKSIIHRRITLPTYLANTSILLFIISPDEMTSLSGILSFAAVSGILFFQKSIRELFYFFRGRLLEWFGTQLSMSVSAGLFVSPILIVVFHAHSFISVIFNLFAVPVISALMPLLFLGVILECNPVLQLLSGMILNIASKGMELFVIVIDIFSSMTMYKKYATWLVMPFYSSMISLATVVAYYILSRQYRRRYRKYFLLLLLLTLLASGPGGYYINS